MIPLPTRSVFRSRWKALAWAGAVCVAAVSISGFGGSSKDKQADPNTNTQAAMDDAINAMNTP
jgi:hypothetical protein